MYEYLILCICICFLMFATFPSNLMEGDPTLHDGIHNEMEAHPSLMEAAEGHSVHIYAPLFMYW